MSRAAFQPLFFLASGFSKASLIINLNLFLRFIFGAYQRLNDSRQKYHDLLQKRTKITTNKLYSFQIDELAKQPKNFGVL